MYSIGQNGFMAIFLRRTNFRQGRMIQPKKSWAGTKFTFSFNYEAKLNGFPIFHKNLFQ